MNYIDPLQQLPEPLFDGSPVSGRINFMLVDGRLMQGWYDFRLRKFANTDIEAPISKVKYWSNNYVK